MTLTLILLVATTIIDRIIIYLFINIVINLSAIEWMNNYLTLFIDKDL